MIGTVVKRALRGWVPALAILLAAAGGAPANARTWSEAVAAYAAGDYAAAYRGFRSHAERGDASAQYRLGVMYYLGRGVAA